MYANFAKARIALCLTIFERFERYGFNKSHRLAKAALNQLRTQRLAEGGYTDAVDDALTRLLHAHTPLFIW